MNKKKTLLFGGAFDPPHKGHICTAITAMSYKEFNGDAELWFLPCYSDAFGQKKLVAPEHRVAMLNHVVDFLGQEEFKVCTIEIEIANFAGTYAIVMELRRRYPDREFYYVIGSDQAGRIRQWRNSRDLLKTIPFVIIKRPLSFGSVEWCFSKPHIWIENQTTVFSQYQKAGTSYQSSGIRKMFHDNWEACSQKLISGLLYETYLYILANKLYRKE
jgi:nicotinate-nucleotide adenylyltransferase